nr:MAG TPA: hypothetical protein [Caudoviricetes sp.]
MPSRYSNLSEIVFAILDIFKFYPFISVCSSFKTIYNSTMSIPIY